MAWASSVRCIGPEVVAIDGKTLRGSKTARDGSGAPHLISAYATRAGLGLGQRAVDIKFNDIKLIPEISNMLTIEGAIVTIDAMGTQKAITACIVDKKADYVIGRPRAKTRFSILPIQLSISPIRHLPRKAKSRSKLTGDTAASMSGVAHPTPNGSPNAILDGKIRSLAQIDAVRSDEKTGAESRETRICISSLEPNPKAILDAARSHGAIENRCAGPST